MPRCAGFGVEHPIGGQRPGDVDSLGPEQIDGRGDDLDLLAPEAPVLARVRLEPGDRDTRTFDPEIASQRRRGDRHAVAD